MSPASYLTAPPRGVALMLAGRYRSASVAKQGGDALLVGEDICGLVAERGDAGARADRRLDHPLADVGGRGLVDPQRLDELAVVAEVALGVDQQVVGAAFGERLRGLLDPEACASAAARVVDGALGERPLALPVDLRQRLDDALGDPMGRLGDQVGLLDAPRVHPVLDA